MELKNETDNQQERFLDKESANIGYLSGIIDGEGSIMFNIFKNPNYYNGRVRFTPMISISNSSKKMLDKVAKILHKIGIDAKVYFRDKESKYYKKETALDMWIIIVRGHWQIRKVLSIITPFLEAKKKQAVIMKRYLDNRIKYLHQTEKRKDSNCVQKVSYQKKDVKRVLAIKILNNPGKSSETIRQTFSDKTGIKI